MNSYAPLITIELAHAYYREACRDLDFVVPRATAQLMRDNAMTAKVRDGRLYVYWSHNKAHATGACPLRFGLRLLNPQFSNFTRLEYDPRLEIPLYRNLGDPNRLDPLEPVRLIGRCLSHEAIETGRPLTVSLLNGNGTTLDSTLLTEGQGAARVAFDLSRFPDGCYRIVEGLSGASRGVAYFKDQELSRLGIFGIIEITVAEAFYGAPPLLTIPFQAAAERLKYYVVANNYSDKEVDQLAITDLGHEPGTPDLITFSKLAHSSEPQEQSMFDLLKGQGRTVLLFRSSGEVRRQQSGQKKIQLTKNGDVLIRNLPQPGPNRGNGDVIIHISK